MPNTKVARWLDAWYPIAQRFAIALFIFIAFLIILLASPAQGDDLTGMAQDDPKDLALTAPPCAPTGLEFQPLPSWSRHAVMPPLPQVLKPMGTKVVVNTTPPAPAPLAPPKEATTEVAEKPKPTPPPAPTPAPSPALIAVSPFLQWIQANPQAAAAQARQQAGAYQAAPPVAAAAPPGASAPTSNTPTGPVDPYWLPPLIDTAPFGVQSTGGSSAAIYETPQR